MTVRQLLDVVDKHITIRIRGAYLGNSYFSGTSIGFYHNLDKYGYMLDWRVSRLNITRGDMSAWFDAYVEVEE